MTQTEKVFRIKLDMPVSLNDCYEPAKNFKTGKLFIRKTYKAKQYQKYVEKQILLTYKSSELFNFKGLRLEVNVHMYPKQDNRDLDNILKLLLDSLQSAKVIKNDRCITNLNLWKHKPCELNGFITVEIKQETDDY